MIRVVRPKSKDGKFALPPRGAFCVHRRMRKISCGSEMCVRPCRVECPDCGLSWMLYEGILG